MKNLTNKSKISTIALILVLTFSGIIATISTVKTVNSTKTFASNAFVAVSPNPAGVNQEVTIVMWLIQFNPTSSGVGGGRWENFSLLITAPDETTQNLGPFTADPAAYAYAIYTPTQIGTHTIKFTFPGQLVQGASGFFGLYPIDNYYEASSFTTTVTVQNDPATTSPQAPLPTDYWTRPIDAQNQYWDQISGNWLSTPGFLGAAYNGSGAFNPYTEAPNSAHIVWTKPLAFGGLIGGEFGGTTTSNYYTGKSYEGLFTPPIIMNGVLYYNSPAPPRLGFYAVDLRTGETLWYQNTTGELRITSTTQGYWDYPGISQGQVYTFESPNQIGGIPYLWYTGSSPWIMYDAVTGEKILDIENARGGPTVIGPNGEMLVYVLTSNWLAMWNSSKCIGTLADQFPPELFSTYTGYWCYRPAIGSTLDWYSGVQWNVTVPAIPGQAISKIQSDVILATTGGSGVLNSSPKSWQMEIGYDTKTGEQLWVQNRTFPVITTGWGVMQTMGDGIYTEFMKETMQYYAYYTSSGELAWGPTEAYTNAWGSQVMYAFHAYGNLYGRSMDGIHAFDTTTGEKLWDFYGDVSGLDIPGFSNYPFLGSSPTIADGKVFVGTGNTHGGALYRGNRLYAIDAMSGEQVWSINGFFYGTLPVADGYLVSHNGYDNQIYCFGKGQTETTVTAAPKVVTDGSSVIIEGTVTDESPGTKQDRLVALFPNGVPAISDEDMSEWMEHLYMQQPMPADAEGVEVVITTLDPNGNTYEIGRTTSSNRGTFGCEVDLPVPGLYKIIATFEGSDSYYASSAETYVSVTEAPSAAQPIEPEPTEPEPTEPTEAFALTTTELAIIAVVIAAVVGIVAFWILRKRK